MKGDRERCLESGMDGYVSKPIQAAELHQTIAEVYARFAPAQAPDRPVETFPPAVTAELPFDPASSLALVEDDQALLVEIIELFLDESPRLMTTIQHTCATGESAELMRAAHTLKGMAGNFGAPKVVALAFELELSGKNGRLDNALPLCETLDQELTRLQEALAAYRQEQALAPHPAFPIDALGKTAILQRVAL
jgi:two-component system sensor histidine kinase/response regulator